MYKRQVQRYQYIKLLDQTTGQLRVERGEATVFPREHEVAAEGGVKDAVNVDDETAVLVLSKASGQQRLMSNSLGDTTNASGARCVLIGSLKKHAACRFESTLPSSFDARDHSVAAAG